MPDDKKPATDGKPGSRSRPAPGRGIGPSPDATDTGPNTAIITGPRTNATGGDDSRRSLGGGGLTPGADVTTQGQDNRSHDEVPNVGDRR
jgi:hypothetical protein